MPLREEIQREPDGLSWAPPGVVIHPDSPGPWVVRQPRCARYQMMIAGRSVAMGASSNLFQVSYRHRRTVTVCAYHRPARVAGFGPARRMAHPLCCSLCPSRPLAPAPQRPVLVGGSCRPLVGMRIVSPLPLVHPARHLRLRWTGSLFGLRTFHARSLPYWMLGASAGMRAYAPRLSPPRSLLPVWWYSLWCMRHNQRTCSGCR